MTLILDRVRVERVGAVAHVQLHRPEKHNGLDCALIDALIEAAASLSDSPGLRAVVLSGAGPSFCAGLDFPSFLADSERLIPHLMDELIGPANRAQQVAWAWRALPVPVIAALHGHVYGGGLQIALGADLRLVHPEARLSIMEIHYGLIPDMGFTQTVLPHLRPDQAMELTLTGRKVGAEEAVQLGLCTRIEAEPLEAALRLAETIAARSPHAIRAAKQLIREARGLDVATGLNLEARLQRGLLGSPNQLEAVMANFERRPAVFVDPS